MMSAEARLAQAEVQLHQAQVILERTSILLPIDSYVTNLLVQRGHNVSCWREHHLGCEGLFILGRRIFRGNKPYPHLCRRFGPDQVIGYSRVVRGHVDSIARAIDVANAQPNNPGVAECQRHLHLGALVPTPY
jgi:hypothetical protein